nr:multidrug effflux MFS transporter [Citreicella sp. C3M06]
MRTISAPGRVEFIALLATLFATIAFSIDAMLPALPDIGAELTPDDLNRAQLVVTSFVLGMGIGTLFTGPLSDSFGRKPVIVGGAALYIAMSLLAASEDSLEGLLFARMLQGLGGAAPRVVALAIVRDLHSGRSMARIMSFVMMVFTLFPAVAPSIGALIIDLSGWRAIFWAFVLLATVSSLWLILRLPETLPREKRRPFSIASLRAAVKELLGNPVVRIAILIQALIFGMMFAMISSVQQVYDVSFGMGESFPIWFAVVALCAASGSLLNASIVMRFGMRSVIRSMLCAGVIMSALALTAFLVGLPRYWGFGIFLFWQWSVFFQLGLTVGNINAIAMEPVGHIAGLAASLIGAIATVIAVIIAAPVGLLFNGTPLPLAAAILILECLALSGMLWLLRVEARQ